MRALRLMRLAGSAAGLVLAAAFGLSAARAADVPVTAEEGRLVAALAAARPGDVLELAAGVHRGRLVIERPVTLLGQPGAVIQGTGEGSVITVLAPGVAIEHLEIRGSGSDLSARDSAILIKSAGARIEDNRLSGNLFGVYLVGAGNALVRGNTILGREDSHVSQRGDGISIWNSPGARIVDNDIRLGRDGIFVTTSRNNLFSGNRFRSLRIAVHYMYTNYSEVSGNVSLGNFAGYALMYSHHLVVRDNVSERDRDQGILLNYANDSLIAGNRVSHGESKCVFIYNSSKNEFRRNVFEGCPIGIHFTGGSERNTVVDNAFVANRNQVKYVGTRWVEWSEKGRGNYWSDNPAFDLDGDGIADMPYRPNDVVDRVVWAHPLAKLLLTSPAMQLLRFAEAQFPGLHPGGVIDRAPLMSPPAPARLAATKEGTP